MKNTSTESDSPPVIDGAAVAGFGQMAALAAGAKPEWRTAVISAGIVRAKRAYDRAEKAWLRTREDGIAAGVELAELKKTVPHGSWLPLLEEMNAVERTVQHYMAMARNAEKVKNASLADLHSFTDGFLSAEGLPAASAEPDGEEDEQPDRTPKRKKPPNTHGVKLVPTNKQYQVELAYRDAESDKQLAYLAATAAAIMRPLCEIAALRAAERSFPKARKFRYMTKEAELRAVAEQIRQQLYDAVLHPDATYAKNEIGTGETEAQYFARMIFGVVEKPKPTPEPELTTNAV